MRVLYLNPFSQEVSGPDESLRTLLEALIPLGVEPHLVLPRPGPQVARYEALGAKVHYAPLTILKRRLGLGAALLPFHLARGVAALVALARREKIDLIHTNMEVVLDGAFASRLLGIPHILHYRGNTNDDPMMVFDVLTRFWTRMADRVFCISHATAHIFLKRGLGSKVHTLYNPVDVDAFVSVPRIPEVRREFGADSTQLLVGTVGRIHPRKDIETFVRCAALVASERSDVRFVIVGSAETPEEQAYERRVRALATELRLEDRLVWAGSRRDIPAVMKALDVFVLCSRNEGFGRVIAEAVAAGTRVVGSGEGAIPELLAESRGDVARPGDACDFAVQILRSMVTNPPVAAMQAFAYRSFSPRVLAAAVHEAYRVYSASRRPRLGGLGSQS